ncbi:LysM peptidoglycan-binding domain-containing protein [Microbacterium jejuense]|uniref:LysM peptidoglycan-binding domain-containing protein n=1 Tax=Microbacterium jejuense TaxID=1263637 RepID=A0ABS7HPA8_9MICO|nr:LysM peptidoglycan-binding domain-containing protein [Microbacterium jejuense]
MPVAVAGSIALTLTAAPAHAATADAPRSVGPLAVVPQPVHATAATVTAAHAATAVPAVTVVATQAAPATYTVVRGDTVSRIAARFGLRTADVLALNGLGWSSVIYPGQVLKLTAAGAAAPAAPTAPAAPSAGAGSYTVQRGDTISSIARRLGVTTNAVLSANGLGWSSIIYPGQRISIPGAAAPAASAPAAPATPAPPPAAAPSAGGAAYTIVAGDTISAIAKRHGVTVSAVLAANGLSMSSIICPGQTITVPATQPSIPGLTAEQVANAQLIVRIGRELGVPDRGIAIALGTAMQESSLRNVTWGDRDSLGLFQQRPSYGWGTEAEVQDAARATRAFFGGAGDPNGARTRGLLDIPGWQNLTFTQAAQAVQISAYPDAYAKWEAPAASWLAAIG